MRVILVSGQERKFQMSQRWTSDHSMLSASPRSGLPRVSPWIILANQVAFSGVMRFSVPSLKQT